MEKAKKLQASEAKKSEYGDSAKYVTFVSADKKGQKTDGKVNVEINEKAIDVMNGFEATRAIRKLPRADAASIPIIALSANVSGEDVAASRECGMNGHLAKPLDIPQLIERMDYWLHNPAG